MIMSRSIINIDQCLNTGGHNTELFKSFVYLGPCTTGDNNEFSEMQRRHPS
jgi:hypothetical protein